MEKRFKGLIAIQDVLDDRYQKLCDRYHNLELSHNRKKRVLKLLSNLLLEMDTKFQGHDILYDFPKIYYVYSQARIESYLKLIDDALWCDGRERSKCIKVKKAKVNITSKGSKKNVNSSNPEK